MHILSLLRLYDAVVLPGMGVLRMKYIPAVYESLSRRFFPPNFDLTFEPCDAENDRRLQDSYVRREDVTPMEASVMLSSDITALRNAIAFGGEALLEGVGIFTEEEGALSFRQELVFNELLPVLDADIMGCNAREKEEKKPVAALLVVRPETADETKSETEIQVRQEMLTEPEPEFEESSAETKAGFEETSPEIEAEPEPERVEAWRNPDYYYIPVHKKVAKIAACLLLVVVVGLVTLLGSGPSNNKPSTASIVPLPVAEDTAKLPLEEPVAANDSIMELPEAVPAPGDKYYAIVAAFKTQNEAEKFIDSHKGDTSRFEIIKNKKYYMISASSAAEKEELDTNMPLIRTHYPDAWIFTMP